MSKSRDIVETLRTVLVDGDVTNANFTGADLDITKGGTGASSAGAARTALGLAIGSDVQAHDADTAKLDAAANFTGTLQRSGTNVLVAGDVTNANFTGADLEIGKGGTGSSTAPAARTALGLAIGSDVQAYDANTAKLDEAANFTNTLQNGGSNVIVDSDIGTTVLAPNGSAANLTNLPAGGAEDFVASGALPNGKPVILNSNGTATAVGLANISEQKGALVTYDTGPVEGPSAIVHDSNSNRIAIAYGDANNGKKPTVIIGTVAANGNLSFGTPVVISNDSVYYNIITAVFTNNNKVAICYHTGTTGSTNLRIYTGVISGSTISMSSGLSISDTNTNDIEPRLAIDSGNFVMLAYLGESSSQAGVRLRSINVNGSNPALNGSALNLGADSVGQGGISISLAYNGSAHLVTHTSGTSGVNLTGASITRSGSTLTKVSSASFTSKARLVDTSYHSGQDVFLVAYRDSVRGNDGYLVAFKLDASNAVTVGTEIEYDTVVGGDNIPIDYGHATDMNVIFKNAMSSSYCSNQPITLSGTSITLGTIQILQSVNSAYVSAVFDSTNTTTAIVFVDYTNNNGSKVFTFRSAHSIANLTATNFLGTATAAYTNGQTASIMLKGGISDNQSSLTVGSTYYVQTNGTFATSAGTPSVLAGKAVSATSLLLNGLAPTPPVIPEEIPSQSGNTGKFLTTNGSAASWGTVSAGMTLLSTVTASGVTTVLVDDGFDSTYDSYVLIASSMQASANGTTLLMRLKIGGSVITSQTYYYRSIVLNSNDSGNTMASNQGTGTNEVNLVDNMRSRSYHSVDLELKFNNPSSTTLNHNWSMSAVGNNEDNRLGTHIGGGTNKTLAAMTGVQLKPSGGTLSGTFRLYGVTK